ncbi:hypothetical protein [Sphingobacterium rhinopitheci]|uniref:hypothetical protein n=1 Tax=Sphingobacterium rhinopitheci TaxID=2781960 RepID=UPI001F51C0AD|nr:hypothetical protein [Sphingobacterium rhinopitheci]MCI0921810.1 hypothetical protein [Sphingobacterium rhinopitheci]
MDIQILIDKLKKANELSTPVQKHTLIVNEKSETQGALFFIPIEAREYKVLIPAPFHTEVLGSENTPTHQKIVMHKEAFILK